MSQSCTDFRTPSRRRGAYRRTLGACVAAVMLWCSSACTPALNWREVRFENARLTGWLPCKPDRAQRTVQLQGQPVQLTLMGCQADNMDFTLAQLDLPAGMTAGQAQQAWKTANLASLQVQAEVPSQAWTLAGASPVMAPQQAMARGGQGLAARWAWFAYDGQLYQAAVYARGSRTAQAEQAMDGLLSGLRLP